MTAHVDDCVYCQAMLDGLNPGRVTAQREALKRDVLSSYDAAVESPSPLPVGMFSSRRASTTAWSTALGAFAVVSVYALLTSHQTKATLAQVQSEVTNLKTQNAALIATTRQILASDKDINSSFPSAILASADDSPSLTTFPDAYNWNGVAPLPVSGKTSYSYHVLNPSPACAALTGGSSTKDSKPLVRPDECKVVLWASK
jgi:hypothetical protein